MRLWHKIFICTLVLVIAAVDITAALLLSRSYETMLEREKQRAVTEHGYLLATLRSQVYTGGWQAGDFADRGGNPRNCRRHYP